MSDGSVVIDVNVNGKEVEGLNRDLGELEGKSDNAGRSIKDMAIAMGAVKVASAAFNILKDSVGAAVSRFDTMQKYPKVMESLGFSTDQSKNSIDKLGDGIDGLPTKLDDIVGINQRMVAISGDIDTATDATIALNNAFLASGASTDDAARGMDQYIKMLSTGKVEADGWDTLMETMPVSLSKVANALGFVGNDAMVQLKNALQDGTISFDQFQDKMIELGTGTGELAELAKVNSMGIATSFGNLRNAISKNVANIITKIDEMTQSLTGKSIAQHIDSLKGIINSAFGAIINSMDGLLPLFTTLGNFVKENIEIFKTLGVAVGTFIGISVGLSAVISVVNLLKKAIIGLGVTNPITLAIAAISALIAVVVHFYKTSETFRNKVNEIAQSLSSLLAPIGQVMQGAKLLAQGLVEMMNNGPGPKIAELRGEFLKLFPESIWNKMISFSQGLSNVGSAVSAVIGIVSGSISTMDDLDAHLQGAFGEEGTKRIKSIGEAIRGVIDWFKNLSDPINHVNASFDLLSIALKVVQSVILSLMGPFGLIIKAFQIMAKVIGGGEVQAGIQKIMDSISNLASGINTYGPQLGSSFGTALQGILSAIASALPGIISGGLQIVAGLMLGIAQGLPQLAIAASQLIMALTGAILILMPTIVMSATQIILAFIGALTIALPQIILAGVGLINSLIQGITQALPSLIENGANLIVTWLTALNAHLPEILQAGFNLLITFLTGIANNIGQVSQKALDIILNFAQVIIDNMPTIINTAIDLMVNFANALASRMPDIIGSAVTLIASFINGIANNLGQIINAAVNLIVKFLEGIASKIPDIVNAAMNLVDAIVSGVVQAQGRLMDAAINLINGFADNIRNRQQDIRNAALNLLDAIIGVFVPDSLFNAGKAIIDGLLNGIKSAFEGVKDFVGGIADWIAENKGPLPYDRKLLIPAGKAIMGGFDSSLQDNFKYVQKTVSGMAGSLESSFNSLNIPDLFSKISPEVALGVNNMGLANAGSQIVNNSTSSSKTYQPVFHINIEKADLSSDKGVENTSRQLAILTERQQRGRLE